MIRNEKQYLEFIIKQGVGQNDRVASSPKSYLSYLRSVSRLLGKEISEDLISSENDINDILIKLERKRAKSTLNNYKSALRQYLKFMQ